MLALGIKYTQIILSSNLKFVGDITWLFSECVTLNEILFIPNIKLQDKSNLTLSRLMYPILMATEILLCNASVVISGKDQLPNLKITTDIFNLININL